MSFETHPAKLPRTAPVTQCPLCGADGKPFLVNMEDRLFEIPGNYNCQCCKSCDSIFQSPMVVPEDIHLCYPDSYPTHSPPSSKDGENLSILKLIEDGKNSSLRGRLRYALTKAMQGEPLPGIIGLAGRLLAQSRTLRERAFFNITFDELLPRKAKPARALEVGCGGGQTLMHLYQLGWEVTGVDFDEKAASVAHSDKKISVFVGDFRKVDLPLNHYHLIYLSHVFEHIEDPVGTLRRLNDLLEPSGKIVLVCPNPKSLGAMLFKERWVGFDQPRHLVLLPPSAYARAAKLAGLKIKTIYTQCTTTMGLWCIAFTRLDFKGKYPPPNLEINIQDRLLYLVERTAIKLGFSVGEEVVVIMEKARD